MKVVIDASIAIKWIFPEKKDEDHISQALHLLKAIKNGMIKVYQPPHWLAEIAAVVSRLEPAILKNVIDLLDAMEFTTIDIPQIYYDAAQLSQQFKHHLFDTLYHSVALNQKNTYFITADDSYFRKAQSAGNIMRLAEFSLYE